MLRRVTTSPARAKSLTMRGVALDSPDRTGVVAQLVERLNGIQKVRGSTPLGSTILRLEGGPRNSPAREWNPESFIDRLPLP